MNPLQHRVPLPPKSDELFPFQSKPFEIDGLMMAYIDEGPTDGETILCVHGNPTWSFYFRSVVERFRQTHRVIAVDHLGCGRSDKPSQSHAAYTLQAHRDRLIRLVESLDLDRVTLLAHDWGGAIGLATLLKNRERFDRIILLNTGAFLPTYIPKRIAACRIPFLGTFAVRGLNGFAKAAITMAVSRNTLSTPVANGLLAPYDRWANRVAIDAFVKDIPMKPSHPSRGLLLEIEESLPQLSEIPSQLIWGMKDWCFRPECLRYFQRVWPNAQTLEIADAGHYVIEDAPDEVLGSIDSFLNGSP